MSRVAIDDETKQKVLTLYKNGVTNKEISVATDISIQSVNNIIHMAVDKGLVEPKKTCLFNKPITPKGQGKGKYIKKGYNPYNKLLTEEQENQLLEDYFVKNMTYKQIMSKYGVWQGTIKIIVDKAIQKGLYQPKGKGNHRKEKSIEGV